MLSIGYAVLWPDVANVVTVINSSVKFSCTTTTLQQVRWKRYMPKSNYPILLYNGVNIPAGIDPRYDFIFHPKSGRNDLIIDQVREDDGGSYDCLELTTAAQRATFQLVVLGMCLVALLITSCNFVSTRPPDGSNYFLGPVGLCQEFY